MKRTYHKVNPRIAARRKWVKYGESEGDGHGPNRTTTNVSVDEVPIIFSNRKHIVHNQAVTLNEVEEFELQEARKNIKSQLRVHKLIKELVPENFRESEQKIVKPTADGKVSFMERMKANQNLAAGSPAAGDASKMVGLRRPGQMERPGRPGGASSQFAQEEGCTVRVTNFTEHMTEADFTELFNQCGKTKRIYVAKDKKTNKAKGFAYITYERPSEAQNAIKKLNRYPLDHLILNVELSKKEKSSA